MIISWRSCFGKKVRIKYMYMHECMLMQMKYVYIYTRMASPDRARFSLRDELYIYIYI